MSNPYTSPQNTRDVVASESRVPSAPLNRPFASVVILALIPATVCALLVVAYQAWIHSFDGNLSRLPAWHFFVESASFASAGFVVAVAFGIPWDRNDYERYVNRALVFGGVSFLLVIPSKPFMTTSSLNLLGLFVLLPASQMLTVAALCWIRRIRIQFRRLVLCGVAGFGLWFLLTMTAVITFVSRVSHPYDDYAGFSLLTAFWCLAVGLQTPFLLQDSEQRSITDVDSVET